jgi:hypothetical protein
LQNGMVKSVTFEEVCMKNKPLDLSFMNLAEMLAT